MYHVTSGQSPKLNSKESLIVQSQVATKVGPPRTSIPMATGKAYRAFPVLAFKVELSSWKARLTLCSLES